MKKSSSNSWGTADTIVVVTIILFLMMACKQITTFQMDTPVPVPEGYKQVSSANGNYRYLIPANWAKTGDNSFEGVDGKAFEEVYPPATITEEYCRSFTTFGGGNYKYTEVENRVYDNSQIQGCYIIQDILNIQFNLEWRHISFRFATDRGVESLTVVVKKEEYNETQVRIIIDSIRVQ